MNYTESKELGAAIERDLTAASALFPQCQRLPNGLTPDHVKFSPEYRAAKAAYDSAFRRLREHNQRHVKTFKAEIRAERRARFAPGPG